MNIFICYSSIFIHNYEIFFLYKDIKNDYILFIFPLISCKLISLTNPREYYLKMASAASQQQVLSIHDEINGGFISVIHDMSKDLFKKYI